MPELLLVHPVHPRPKSSQHLSSLVGDADQHATTILFGAGAGDEPGLRETIDQTRGVGISGDHLDADRLASDAPGPRRGDDAKCVVLRFREPELLEQRREFPGQFRMRSKKIQERLLLGQVEGRDLPDLFLQVSRCAA